MSLSITMSALSTGPAPFVHGLLQRSHGALQVATQPWLWYMYTFICISLSLSLSLYIYIYICMYIYIYIYIYICMYTPGTGHDRMMCTCDCSCAEHGSAETNTWYLCIYFHPSIHFLDRICAVMLVLFGICSHMVQSCASLHIRRSSVLLAAVVLLNLALGS